MVMKMIVNKIVIKGKKVECILDDGSSFDFELADESRTIVLGNGEKASYGFNDLGPDFIERVKHGPEYESPDGSKKYTFQNEGKTLIFVDFI